MTGDPGPYMDDEGGVWVSRTVPYLRARVLARDAMVYQDRSDDRLVYQGKAEDVELVGFTRDCPCEERCEARYEDDEDTGEAIEVDRTCLVPAWAFQIVER